MNNNVSNIVMEDARIIFRNFAGKETKFNREGSRNFCAVLDGKEEADELSAIGWNVKKLDPRDEDDEPL